MNSFEIKLHMCKWRSVSLTQHMFMFTSSSGSFHEAILQVSLICVKLDVMNGLSFHYVQVALFLYTSYSLIVNRTLVTLVHIFMIS
jgi:hypothetical protein